MLKLHSLLIRNIRSYGTVSRPLILGIETSCDETGAAILDRNGTIYGQCIHSQQDRHLV